VPYADDGTGLTVGTRFETTADGTITAVRLYTSSPAPLDPIDWKIYNTDGTAVLASGTMPAGPAPGAWLEAILPTPLDVTAGTTYVVAAGVLKRYVAASGYFTTPDTAGHLYAPSGAGRFTIGASFVFPSTNYADSGYFVDVAFAPSVITPDVPPPTPGLWMFGDPVAGTLAVLRAATPPAGVSPTWGAVNPETASTGGPSALPYGMVASDGELSKTIADSTATVRLAIWARTSAEARTLAGWAHAVLLASHGDGTNIRKFSRGTGLLSTSSDAALKTSVSSRVNTSGYQICSFTVAARLLPILI
jgi:hypothetical protein